MPPAAMALPPARVAFVLVDGIADVALPSLGYRTILQAARVPYLDAVAAAGINGLMDPVEPALACGSDTAHLSLLGYNPVVYYRGRGAFESMGAGLAMAPGDIAFKSNFATVDDGSGVVVRRRADRQFEREGPILCVALDDLEIPGYPLYRVNVRYATEHRCGVVVRGPNLSGEISGTDPLKDNRLLPICTSLTDSPDAVHTAKVVNALSNRMREILRSHPLNAERVAEGKGPANAVLLRGCGIRIEVPPFAVRHSLRGCMVAPTKIIAGLGISLGIDILQAQGATGDYRTKLTAKAEAISAALSAPLTECPRVLVPGGAEGGEEGPEAGYDFGFLHIKAIDDAGHDKSASLKRRALEAVDRMIGQLAKRLWAAEKKGVARFSICVTGDHSTPVLYGDHSYEPVPFAMCHLAEFVARVGGADAIEAISMEDFPLPTGEEEEEVEEEEEEEEERKEVEGGMVEQIDSEFVDGVQRFDEVAAARGCLGRFPGCEMMTVIRSYAT